METETKTSKIHPLAAAAAVAVILVCATGIAAMTGILPNFSKSKDAVPAEEMAAIATASQPATTADAKPEEQAAEKPVKKYASKRPTSYAGGESSVERAPVASQGPYVPPPQPACPNCGVVESVRTIQQQAPTSGVGAGVGALLGGVLGHQVGGGNGKTLATIAGAVGGGLAGNVVEKRTHTSTSYEVIVRLEDGSHQTFNMTEQRWREGDLVRVDNGSLVARSQ